MKRWLTIGLILGMAEALCACGSIKVHDVNEAELQSVKKVAIASFSFDQPASKMHPGVPGLGQDNEQVGEVLKDINSTLGQKFHWTMLSVEQMKNNPAYKEVYDSKMKGWQNKGPMGGHLLLAPGVMDAQSLRRMKPEQRDQLIAALGVDAIIEMSINISFKGTTVAGIGDRHPLATGAVYMYKKGVERPVWFEGRLQGTPSESVGKTAFWDEADVTRLGGLSAKTAFDSVSLKQEAM